MYEEVSPVVTSVLDGYNVCIFAYGQVSSQVGAWCNAKAAQGMKGDGNMTVTGNGDRDATGVGGGAAATESLPMRRDSDAPSLHPSPASLPCTPSPASLPPRLSPFPDGLR